MVCLREEGNPAGALTTYRRCRELLSIVLGRTPSPETEAVRATLLARGQSGLSGIRKSPGQLGGTRR